MTRRAQAPGFRPSANPDLARWMQALRASNAAEPHTPAPRKGTRRARQHRAIHDQDRDHR